MLGNDGGRLRRCADTDTRRLTSRPRPSAALLGWFAASAAVSVPQAAAPILFALIALPITGSADSGAALVLAMTIAQVLGAVPITRLGRRLPLLASVPVLVALRTLALAAIAVLAGTDGPFALLVAAAAAAGLVAGAVHGRLRAALNALITPSRLPRALGVSATLNEIVFVLSPALASVLGGASPLLAAWTVVVLGAAPLLTLRRGPGGAAGSAAPPSPETGGRRAPLPRQVWLWLGCSASSSAAIATIEIGAVSLAVGYGLDPAWSSIFPVALCLASVAGGLWVSARGRGPRLRLVTAWLGVTTAGIGIVAIGQSVSTTLLGAVLVGAVLAPLGTSYSLILDHLAPPERRAEVFAMLRTASSAGVIVASSLISLASVGLALRVVPALPLLAMLAVLALGRRGRLSAAR
ncbi:MFS transporter [Brachybacterium hainanense]|uniref:MFS transporter n=1 Tax=Brachybacterium hainanense TaxID=1541174 RepID=A0ABV6REA4_9MICO